MRRMEMGSTDDVVFSWSDAKKLGLELPLKNGSSFDFASFNLGFGVRYRTVMIFHVAQSSEALGRLEMKSFSSAHGVYLRSLAVTLSTLPTARSKYSHRHP